MTGGLGVDMNVDGGGLCSGQAINVTLSRDDHPEGGIAGGRSSQTHCYAIFWATYQYVALEQPSLHQGLSSFSTQSSLDSTSHQFLSNLDIAVQRMLQQKISEETASYKFYSMPLELHCTVYYRIIPFSTSKQNLFQLDHFFYTDCNFAQEQSWLIATTLDCSSIEWKVSEATKYRHMDKPYKYRFVVNIDKRADGRDWFAEHRIATWGLRRGRTMVPISGHH